MAGTLTCPVPNNINPLSPNGFLFSIQKLPKLNFFAQEINLPGLTLGAPEFGNPFAIQPIPGETLTYDSLNVRFLIDEDMENYRSLYNWIVALGFPENYTQYVNFKNEDTRGITSELAKNYSDATMQVLGSNNVAVQTIQFIDLFPISITSLIFQSTNTDVQYLVGDATFRFGYYKFT
jgi:hypothetical protein